MEEPVVVRRRRRSGYAQVPYELIRDPTIGDKPLRLWILLESYASWETGRSWPTARTLMRSMGCSKMTLWRAMQSLIERGLVEVESGQSTGGPNVYTVVDPDAVLAQEPVNGTEGGGITHDTGGVSPTIRGGYHPRYTPPTGTVLLKQEPRNKNQELLSADGAEPIDRQAQALTTLAFEQPLKPSLRSRNGSEFLAARGILLKELQRGTSVNDLRQAILAGIEVWTQAGVQTAVAHARRRKGDPVHRGTSLRSTIAEAAKAEAERKAKQGSPGGAILGASPTKEIQG